MQEGSGEFRLEDMLLGSEKRQVEALFDPIQFDELFNFANKLLVSRPVEYDPANAPELSTEQLLVMQFGSRGIRSAYELQTGTERIRPDRQDELLGGSSEDEQENDIPDYADSRVLNGKPLPIRNDGPLRYPELFSGKMDRHAIARAELLGDALMDDMFKTLGQDAYAMADRMRVAETDSEQIAIIKWLARRLHTMVDAVEDEANSPLLNDYRENSIIPSIGFSYHPARISGKLIGVYPNQQLSPTCLGVSIAASGFMKRAGIDFLHAGVMGARSDNRLDSTAKAMRIIPQHAAERFGVVLPEKFQDRTDEGREHLLDRATMDLGYHHCVIVRLQSGKWMQIDPNFRQTRVMNLSTTSARLDENYAFLNDMHSIAPNLEVTSELESFFTLGSRFASLAKELDPKAFPTQDEAKELLLALSPTEEALTTTLYSAFIDPMFNPENVHSETERRSLNFITNFLDKYLPHEQESVERETFLGILENYILDGMSLDSYLERCKTDPSFLERAANDLRAAPFMTMLGLSTNYLDEDYSFFGVHTHVELGLPAARIGMSALGDLAQFHNVSPSPTFWISNWTSLQANTEAVYMGNLSETQKTIITNGLGSMFERELLYSSSYGKIALIQSELGLGEDNEDGR